MSRLLRRLIGSLGSMTLAGFVSANTSGCAQETASTVAEPPESTADNDQYRSERKSLVSGLIAKGIKDKKVLDAIAAIPRHAFVGREVRVASYEDGALPIGQGQTISQPYIVAYMTESLGLKPQDRVLEIGTGSGYQAAVLARLVKDVYSIEIIPELAERAKQTFANLHIENVHVKTGDGYQGWTEEAPFDAVIITAAPPEIPEKLIEQLKPGGKLIVPVGKDAEMQWLVRLTKEETGVKKETLLPVRFVPMVPAAK